tara:strand:- start:8914 stop:9252 length:339 start_codon:yes stop_codon:yes gene_type:complete
MKDPTIPDAKSRKKIMFYDSEDRQIKLRVRCNFDGITQSQFFRMMITGYIENDEHVSKYLEACKEKYKIQGLQKRLKNDQMQKQKKSASKKFALGEDEIENIFDIIETETDL